MTKALIVNLPEFDTDDKGMALKIEGVALPETRLPALQAAVGGYVDVIDVQHPETGAIVSCWINDEGKNEGLPRNDFADTLLTIGGWPGLQFGDWIAGPVVFTGYDPETGESVDVPEEWVSLVNDTFEMSRLLMLLVSGIEVRTA
jgi:hypothetical protein